MIKIISPSRSGLRFRSLICPLLLNLAFRGSYFCFAIWSIWNRRNHVMYRQCEFDIHRVHDLIIDRVVEFWASNSQFQPGLLLNKSLRIISWTTPMNWVKLNTDESTIGNPGRAGRGGLLWDSQGHWIVGFVRNIGITTALAAELWAIRIV
ncbi:hypothetical protein SLA2020_285800 [Shorea laevis]